MSRGNGQKLIINKGNKTTVLNIPENYTSTPVYYVIKYSQQPKCKRKCSQTNVGCCGCFKKKKPACARSSTNCSTVDGNGAADAACCTSSAKMKHKSSNCLAQRNKSEHATRCPHFSKKHYKNKREGYCICSCQKICTPPLSQNRKKCVVCQSPSPKPKVVHSNISVCCVGNRDGSNIHDGCGTTGGGGRGGGGGGTVCWVNSLTRKHSSFASVQCNLLPKTPSTTNTGFKYSLPKKDQYEYKNCQCYP